MACAASAANSWLRHAIGMNRSILDIPTIGFDVNNVKLIVKDRNKFYNQNEDKSEKGLDVAEFVANNQACLLT